MPEKLLVGCDILFVEDETMVSFLIEEMLEKLGAEKVRHAARLDRALELIETKIPTLAILDVNIGGEAVFPLAERLEALDVPFVFITGYGRDGLSGRWLTHNVLQKPLTTREFENGLRKLLER
jgi:DNA-binding response OmpR family regulator